MELFHENPPVNAFRNLFEEVKASPPPPASNNRWPVGDKARDPKSVHLYPCRVQGDKKALGNENTHFCGVGKLHNSGLGPVLPVSSVWPQRRRWLLVSSRWPLISLQWRWTCHDPRENMPPLRPLPITFPSQVVGQSLLSSPGKFSVINLRKEPHTARMNWGPFLQTGTLHSGFYFGFTHSKEVFAWLRVLGNHCTSATRFLWNERFSGKFVFAIYMCVCV